MNSIPIYQVDAFNSVLFKGNPAAVCILNTWLPDEIMQKIGLENNLSETAFLVKCEGYYEIRWFTPTIEVDLCGHATLASAHVLFNFYEQDSQKLTFRSRNRGDLHVTRKTDKMYLDFPADMPKDCAEPTGLREAIGGVPQSCLQGLTDYMLIYKSEEEIAAIKPDFAALYTLKARGVIVTAPGNSVDFVSRFFAPGSGINEDPVTGSAHTMLIPYWAKVLGKQKMDAKQISQRGGVLTIELTGERVKIGGDAVLYMKGEIYL
ncbi:MAG: PhzF family phenazine biosynthesis protein [Ignavibacteriales bacterium]|nr:PhzF family phenazine biosynthesis protein [Ignavibacteriales bacterium]